jgi:hypothetical protein
MLTKLAIALFSLSALCAADKTNLIQQIDANTLQIGSVRLEKKERQLIIPASVNMIEGPIEYILVSDLGKLHESILKTAAEPLHIQTAAMLLLPEPPSTKTPARVGVVLEFPGGKAVSVEEVIENVNREKSLKSGTWRYLGSRLVDGTFIAQRDGSILAIIADPDALIESGRVSAEDDENWRPRKSVLPPVGTPVKLVLTFGTDNTP